MSFPEQLTNSLGFPSSIGGWTEATGCCIQQQKFWSPQGDPPVDNGDPIESTAIKVLKVHDLIDVMQGKNAYIYIYIRILWYNLQLCGYSILVLYINILIFLLGLGCRYSMQMTVSNGVLKVFTCSREEKDWRCEIGKWRCIGCWSSISTRLYSVQYFHYRISVSSQILQILPFRKLT